MNLTRFRLLSSVLAAVGFATVLPAQFSSPNAPAVDTIGLPPTAGMSIQFGASALNSRRFNTQLALQGRGLLLKQVSTVGVETWVRWDHVMLLASSQTYLPVRAGATNYTTETSGQHGSLNIGLPLIIARRTLLYPMAGVGLSSTSVMLRRNGPVDFNDNFRDISSIEGRNIDITARRYQAHIGAGLDHVFKTDLLYVTLGLRAGYTSPLGDTKWRSGPEDVIGAPELGLKGGYARLAIGGLLIKRRYGIVPMVASLLPFVAR